jgi:hypothetical protein
METDLFTLDNRGLAFFGSFSREEREALDALIAPLVNLPEKEWESRGGTRLSLPKNIPMLPLPIYRFDLGPSIRVFVHPNPGGKPEIVDFMHQETIDWWRSMREAEKAKKRKARKSKSSKKTGSRP